MIGLSHVALLVPSARIAADKLKLLGFEVGPEEVWEGEGTKEIYIERNRTNSLLLMEPTKQGAYTRAIEKRGPGIHHIAIDVSNLEVYIDSLSQTGWLLHPKSIHMMKHVKAAYLARPGFPTLIEVQQKNEFSSLNPFVSRIGLSFDSSLNRLLAPIGQSEIVKRSMELKTTIKLNDVELSLADLL